MKPPYRYCNQSRHKMTSNPSILNIVAPTKFKSIEKNPEQVFEFQHELASYRKWSNNAESSQLTSRVHTYNFFVHKNKCCMPQTINVQNVFFVMASFHVKTANMVKQIQGGRAPTIKEP